MTEVSGPNNLSFDRDTAELIIAASRRAVDRIAPAEREVFDGVAAGWREDVLDGRRDWRAPGGSVGFGLDATLVSEVVIQAVAAAFGEVLIIGGAAVRRGWLRWRRRGRVGTAPVPAPASGPAPASASASASESGAAAVALSPADARRLREAARRHAVALGVPADLADLLADAVVGSFAVAPDGS